MTGILGTRIMAALAALFNFLALNLALLVFSLPVITAPAAVSAATRALERWRRDGEDQVVREFLIGFRAQWARQTVLVGVPLAAAVLGVIEVRHFAAGGRRRRPNRARLRHRGAAGHRERPGLRVLAGGTECGGSGGIGGVDWSRQSRRDWRVRRGRPEPAGSTAAEFWTLCVGLAVRNLLVTGPLFLVVVGGAAVLAWIDPPLLLLGLPLLALQLMRVTANFGLRRARREAAS